jgi:hypothetical protein
MGNTPGGLRDGVRRRGERDVRERRMELGGRGEKERV